MLARGMDGGRDSRPGSLLMTVVRSATELADVADPAWPELREVLDRAAVPVSVLPVDAGAAVLFRLQVTARSMLGALALNCGGLLVDHGWLRILGGGHGRLPDLASANALGDPTAASTSPGSLTVAYDVLGGEFAVNGGALPAELGEMYYFAPDSLTWEPIGGGHSAFVEWAVDGGLEEFYGELRWPEWQEEVAALAPDQGITVYPPLWSVEGRDPAAASRRPAALTELLAFRDDTIRQLEGLPSGSRIHVRVADS